MSSPSYSCIDPTVNSVNTRNEMADGVNHIRFATGIILLATVVTGCAGPWAKTSKIQLPTATATPALPIGQTVPSNAPVGGVLSPDESTEDLEEIEVEADEVSDIIIRGQSIDEVTSPNGTTTFREAMPISGTAPTAGGVQQAQYSQMAPSMYNNGPGGPGGPAAGPSYGSPGSYGAPASGSYGSVGQTYSPPPAQGYAPPSQGYAPPPSQGYAPPSAGYGTGGDYVGGDFIGAEQGYGPVYSPYDGSGVVPPYTDDADYADLVVNLRETQTGRFMFGVGVNSDLGLTAQAIIDERNFDWRRWPRSLDDIINGTAWRGGGQSLRIEAVPGTEVQRYMVNFTQPYLFDTPISFNLSGYLYDRRYFDWDEQRVGARVGLGYRITPDLSLAVSLRGEQVDFHNPRVRGIPIIERVLGESDIFSGKISLTHDTRDLPFAATEGHYLEISYEQVFGSFDYPRANIDYRRYYLLKQRADGSGRHTLGFSFRGGITGEETPVYENFFAGGYSTMRGFRFRHASPKIADVIVGGQLSLLGTAEYIFPITADDMLKGALFCDYGTIEESYKEVDMEDFRVAVGAGLRITVPAMGPAPIAVDFAVPLAREDTDRIQNFSFFVGFGR